MTPILILFAVLSSFAGAAPRPEQPPNILLVMVDDMGYSDLGCYGGEVRTPTLDSLAENGVRLARFYNCAQCCPTRASLMTGLYRRLLDRAKSKDKLDAVVIATPDHHHAQAAILSLQAGLDVYLEKPLTVTIRDEIP